MAAPSFVSPIGSWLVKIDGALVSGMDTALQGMVPLMGKPVASAVLVLLATMGVQIAQGSAATVQRLPSTAFKIIVVVGLATNIGPFDTYVRGLFYNELPGVLASGVGGRTIAAGIQAVAATFDGLWSQTWDIVGAVWSQAAILDVSSRLAAAASAAAIGVSLFLMAGVYLLARMLLAIVIVLGPPAIACTLSPKTTPIFERWMGKVIALTCLQVAVVVLLKILLAGDEEFMAQMLASAQTVAPPASQGFTPPPFSDFPIPLNGDGSFGVPPSLAVDLQNLVAIVIWFGMGAFAMYALPAVAYSIGTGIATNAMPLLAGGALAAGELAYGALSGLSLGGGESAAGALGEISLSLNRAEIGAEAGAGGGHAALPPPPPPPLFGSNPPMIEGY